MYISFIRKRYCQHSSHYKELLWI